MHTHIPGTLESIIHLMGRCNATPHFGATTGRGIFVYGGIFVYKIYKNAASGVVSSITRANDLV